MKEFTGAQNLRRFYGLLVLRLLKHFSRRQKPPDTFFKEAPKPPETFFKEAFKEAKASYLNFSYLTFA